MLINYQAYDTGTAYDLIDRLTSNGETVLVDYPDGASWEVTPNGQWRKLNNM